jgi:hypothetical protein
MRKTVLLLVSMAVALVVAGGAALAVTPICTTAGTEQGALTGAKALFSEVCLDRRNRDVEA